MKEFTETAVPSFSRAQLMTPDKRNLSGSLFPGNLPQKKLAIAKVQLRLRKTSANSLNSNQERRLSVTCRYIDNLLGDMETSLNISASTLAFPHYALDVSSAQRGIVEDYILRIRAQLVKVLDSHGVERPTSDIPVSRSLRANLAFINIAVEELNPEYMKGYGEVSPAAAAELRQISAELQALATQLDQYLAHELRENPSERRENIEKS